MMNVALIAVLAIVWHLMRKLESRVAGEKLGAAALAVLVVVMGVLPAAGADVMITAGGASHVALAYHQPTGNLFAVIQEGSDWSLFISTDRGASWTEAFDHDAVFFTGVDIDMQVQGDYVYLVTSYAHNLSGGSAALIRRFSAVTGAYDEAWGGHTVISHDDRAIHEVALVVDEGGSILVGLLYDMDYIMVRVSHVSNPAQWANHDPVLTNAERGLDMAWPGPDSTFFLCLTYVGTDGHVYLIRLNDSWYYTSVTSITGDDGVDKSSVAANADGVIVAWSFKDPASPYQGVRSLYGSKLWQDPMDWDLLPVWESPSTAYHDPIVAMNDSSSNAIIYEQAGSIILRHHFGYDANWESAPIKVNEHDFVLGAGDTFAFVWLDGGYGIVYPAASGGVYFSQPVLFVDGFDRGDSSAWTSVVD